jgi:hypothetical protein
MRRRARATAAIGLAVVLVFLGIQLEGARHASAILELKSTYELVGADGGVFAFGGATFSGSLGDRHIRHKIVGVLGHGVNGGTYGPGYLLVDDAGIVYPFGLRSLGDLRGVALQAPIVGASEVAGGYLLVAADGGVFAFGDAKFHGSLVPSHLPAPIVGIAPGSGGYRLVDRDGRVYGLGGAGSFGDLASTFSGSPVVGIAQSSRPVCCRDGYLLATANGKVFAFGTARFSGDAANFNLRAPIVGIIASGGGYYLFASDGGVFAFGGDQFLGSMSGRHLNAPISAMAMQVVVLPPRCSSAGPSTPATCLA